MTQFQCKNCREVQTLNSTARFCPLCGSTSLANAGVSTLSIAAPQAPPADPPATNAGSESKVTVTDDYGYQIGHGE